ncbi:hypothetical protein Tco_0642464 [Tanacetum coccineum]
MHSYDNISRRLKSASTKFALDGSGSSAWTVRPTTGKALSHFMPTTWKALSALYGITLYKVTSYPFDYRVTLGFGSIAGGLDPVSPVTRLPYERGINSGTMIVDINTLTIEQYLALSQENQAPGVVKPKIESNVNFEIKSQFMQELREETFSGNKNEDAHDHVDRVLNIVSLFNILGVSQDAVLLRVFPFTLTGTAKRWVDRLTPGAVNTWDLLKKAFIQRYCPPSKTAKRLEDIHNFKQEINESLYQAWERFNDLLYKCPTHDINSHQKVNIFYKGLSTMNRQLLDSQGPIPGMTPTQALTAIQTMADHSQKWHDGTLSRSLSSSSNTDGLAAIVSKLDNLGRDMKKLKENVHAIQVGCQICEGPHLDKECPLNEEVKQVEEAKYGEFGRPALFNESNGAKYHVFDLEIDQLADEYELKIGKKGHMLDKIWEYCENVHRNNTYWWHDHGLKEEERKEMGIRIKKYDPPEV